MSHRICYGHLAIRFPLALLQSADPQTRFYSDQILLLELGGDNNMTTYHPVSRREVGSRRWMLCALGDECDIVREACKTAAYCEGGGMRLYGERRTLPESYIRRIRTTLKQSVSVDAAARGLGFSLTVTLSMDPLSERGKAWTEAAESLSNDVPRQEEGGLYRWSLLPLQDIRHAAHLFARYHVDTSDPWNMAKVEGPTFDFDQAFKGLQTRQRMLDLSA